jgi:uncharacterized membrane protein
MSLTRTTLATLVAATLSVSTLHADTRPFAYSDIVLPGAVASAAYGINAGGDIVGTYVDQTGGVHGWLWTRGAVTVLDFPGARATEARGIGPGGDIVGTYTLPGEGGATVHGYVRTRDGTFTAVDVGGYNVVLERILPDGTILGCRHVNDMTASMQGMVIDKDGAMEVGEFGTMHMGGTPGLGLVVGFYYPNPAAPAYQVGYTITQGTFTAFMVPGSTWTAAWDVNPRGAIAGVYRDATGFHGFVREGDVYDTVHVPGAAATRAFGLNAGGDVVGSFVLGGVTRAFVASRTQRHGK